MARKAKVTDAPIFLLLHEIRIYAIFPVVKIRVYIHLAHIMEKIEVEVVYAKLFKLTLEDLFYFIPICRVVSRKLSRKIKTISMVACESFSHNEL